ncbi:hypothetical protein [Curtobacterium sp. 24E2]
MLRSRAGSDLVDFVTLVVQEMRLDIEVAAHEQGSGAYLDAFIDELAGFVSTDDRADLGSFLGGSTPPRVVTTWARAPRNPKPARSRS